MHRVLTCSSTFSFPFPFDPSLLLCASSVGICPSAKDDGEAMSASFLLPFPLMLQSNWLNRDAASKLEDRRALILLTWGGIAGSGTSPKGSGGIEGDNMRSTSTPVKPSALGASIGTSGCISSPGDWWRLEGCFGRLRGRRYQSAIKSTGKSWGEMQAVE